MRISFNRLAGQSVYAAELDEPAPTGCEGTLF
jgi:hypothetical protein